MGRFANPYGDDGRLPEGMTCTGYADTGRRYYFDSSDGSRWVGAPYATRGVLQRLESNVDPEATASRQARPGNRKQSFSSTKDTLMSQDLKKVPNLTDFTIPELKLGSSFSELVGLYDDLRAN